MKKVPVFATLLVFFSHFSSVFGQKLIQFADPLPFGSVSKTSTDPKFFGRYKSSDLSTTYIVDESGIYILSLVVASVTREQVRENAKLRVSGDYLHGIKENDSVPCVLEGENYYYGVTQKLPIAGEGSLNTLTQVNASTYVINFHEGDYFEPSLVVFSGNKMTIVHGEMIYQDALKGMLQIKTITRYGSEVAILASTFEQWEQLARLLFEGKKLVYTKE